MSERILIVSDTHGRLNYFKEMLARTGKPDRLIHLGDSEGQQDEIARLAGCPVDIVRGNCDYSSDLAQDKLIEIGKYRVFLTHGHRYQVNFGIQTLKEAALLRGADIAMYGRSNNIKYSSCNRKNKYQHKTHFIAAHITEQFAHRTFEIFCFFRRAHASSVSAH